MQRLTDLSKGLAGLFFTLALLLGVPAGLLATVGWPLPTRWPGADVIGRHLTNGDIPDSFIIKLIAVIIWVTWVQLMFATVVEYNSILKGKVATRAPALPGVRLLAAKLAAWTSLVVSAAAPITPAAAVPLHSVSASVETPAVEAPTVNAYAEARVVTSAEQPVAAQGHYRTAPGDTWWDISERLLGAGLRWNEIRSLNLDSQMSDGEIITTSTDTVKPGWLLVVPAEADLPETFGQSATTQSGNGLEDTQAASSEVIVEEGDHFWSIAKKALADSWGREPTDAELTPYWLETVKANEGRLLPPNDPNLIYRDQAFVLPVPPPNPDVAVDLNGTDVLDPPVVPDTSSVPVASSPDDDSEPVETPAVNNVSPAPTQEPTLTTPDNKPAREATEPETPRNGVELAGVLDEAGPVALIAGALGLFGAMLVFALRRLRSIQAARRRPGTPLDAPDDEAAKFEQRIRSIGTDGEDIRYIAAANHYLSHMLEDASTPIPSLIAIRAGQFGLEFLLDEPCEPIAGFHSVASDKTAWRLNADLDVRMMEGAVNGDAHPFAPALCVVGSTEAGSLLIDLEQLGAVSIEGDPKQVVDVQRGLLASVCVAPWATECEIVAIGIDGLTGEHLSRATIPADPTAWAEKISKSMNQIASTLDRSPYEERVNHGAVYQPTIVFVGPDEKLAGVAQFLAPLAELAHAPLVVVSAHPLTSEYRIPLEGGVATLEPFGITFTPVLLEASELAAVDHLLANASDTTTSPPADDWAIEIAQNGAAEIGRNGDRSASNGHSSAAGSSNGSERTNGTMAKASKEGQPSEETMKRIEEILRPKPVEVKILGRHPKIEGLDGEATPKIEAIITYLAFHREVAGQRLRDEFWPGSTSRQACDNAIGRARTLLGVDNEDESRLVTLRATHSYRLSDEVGVDWHRVEALMLAARGRAPSDETAFLDAVCELIDGRVAADARPANYGWMLREPTIYTLIETTLVDAAHRRGELALEVGDTDRANWAARKGLAVVEGQEAMYRMKMEAEAKAGNIEGVKAAYREAQRAAELYGYDEEVQPETQALFERLAGRRSPRVVNIAEA